MDQSLLCSPVLVPQIVGGVTEPGLVTVNVSWRHLVCSVVDMPPATPNVGIPFKTLLDVILVVDGPLTTNMLKSSRS